MPSHPVFESWHPPRHISDNYFNFHHYKWPINVIIIVILTTTYNESCLEDKIKALSLNSSKANHAEYSSTVEKDKFKVKHKKVLKKGYAKKKNYFNKLES